MTLIQHKKGNVYLPKYGIKFPKGEAVKVEEEKLVEKILRNKDFFKVETKKGGKTNG